MSLLNLYNPYISPDRPTIVQFVLSYGDSIAIGRGTTEFMQALLADLGVQTAVRHWNMQVCRSNYYSGYPSEGDWQDRWPLVWRVRIELVAPHAPLPTSSFPFIGTDAFDATSPSEPMPADDATLSCLVCADFATQSGCDTARQIIGEARASGGLQQYAQQFPAQQPAFNQIEVLDGYLQLQIDLGTFPGAFFAVGAPYAEAVIAICRSLGGTVNVMDRAV